jgi:hypothetical protein
VNWQVGARAISATLFGVTYNTEADFATVQNSSNPGAGDVTEYNPVAQEALPSAIAGLKVGAFDIRLNHFFTFAADPTPSSLWVQFPETNTPSGSFYIGYSTVTNFSVVTASPPPPPPSPAPLPASIALLGIGLALASFARVGSHK